MTGEAAETTSLLYDGRGSSLTSVSPLLASTLAPLPGDEVIAGKSFLIVLCGILHRVDVYKQAAALGAKIYVIDDHISPWASPFVNEWLITDDPYSPDAVSAFTSAWLKSRPDVTIDGVLTFDEYGILAAARLVDDLGLPGTPFKTVSAVKNKYTFRRLTSAAGVPAPRSVHLSVSALLGGCPVLSQLLDGFPFPCVLKPLAGAGSHFVRRIASLGELATVLCEYHHEAASTGEVAAWGAEPSDQAFMIEEMVRGNEVDVDILVDRGQIKYLTVSDNFPSRGPAHLFMEAGGAMPSILPAQAQDRIRAVTRSVIEAFGTDLHGCFHFEAIWTGSECIPIELNQRLGGSEVLVLALAVHGVNLGIQAMRLALGQSVAHVDTTLPLRHCASVNFLAPDSGYITRVGCMPEVLSDPRYMGSMHRVAVGSPLKAPPLAFEFLGWMVASGGDFAEAKRAVDELTEQFYCEIKEFERGDPHGIVPGTDIYYKDWTDPASAPSSATTAAEPTSDAATFAAVPMADAVIMGGGVACTDDSEGETSASPSVREADSLPSSQETAAAEAVKATPEGRPRHGSLTRLST